MAERRRGRQRAPHDPVAREVKDILLKRLAEGLGGGFLAALGLDLAPVVAALPAELPILEVRVERPDRLFLLADGTVLHLEFQTTTEAGDLRRFYRYQYAATEHHDRDVYTVVLYGPDVATAPDTLRRGSAVYTVRGVFIGERDAEETLVALRRRLSLGGQLTPEEEAHLKLLPLMRQRRPLAAVLRDAAALIATLPRAVRDDMLGTMVGLAYTYLTPETVDSLLKEPDMANALERLVGDSLLKGRAEGRVEGKHEDILAILAARFIAVPTPLGDRVRAVTDPSRLHGLVTRAALAASLDEFAAALDNSGGVDRKNR